MEKFLCVFAMSLCVALPAQAHHSFSAQYDRDDEVKLDGTSLKPGEQLVLLPWAEAKMKTLKSQDDPQANCMPSGVPRSSPYPWRMVHASSHEKPSLIFMLFEGNIHSYRQIFMDGREHPPSDELVNTWFGHSIGKWEGDTLVVDSVGFNDKFWFDYLGHPHTEQLHIVERYTRSAFDKMDIEVTIDDPAQLP